MLVIKKIEDNKFWELDYFNHCVNYCQKYKNLGVIKKCEDCKLIFITTQTLRRHLRTVHYRQIESEENIYDGTVLDTKSTGISPQFQRISYLLEHLEKFKFKLQEKELFN